MYFLYFEIVFHSLLNWLTKVNASLEISLNEVCHAGKVAQVYMYNTVNWDCVCVCVSECMVDGCLIIKFVSTHTFPINSVHKYLCLCTGMDASFRKTSIVVSTV